MGHLATGTLQQAVRLAVGAVGRRPEALGQTYASLGLSLPSFLPGCMCPWMCVCLIRDGCVPGLCVSPGWMCSWIVCLTQVGVSLDLKLVYGLSRGVWSQINFVELFRQLW